MLRGPGRVRSQSVDRAIEEFHANSATRQALIDALDDAQLLSTCRVCGDFVPPSSFLVSAEGFKAECACGNHWTFLVRRGASPQASFRIGDRKRPFDEIGSLQLDIVLETRKPIASLRHQR